MIKDQRLWVIVSFSTILMVLILFFGITYAYFSANNNMGSTALIINTSGKMTITYADGGSKLLVSSNIAPSNNIIADKTFSLTGINTSSAGNGLLMDYSVGIKYNSTFSAGQIHYYIKKVNSSLDTITANYAGVINSVIPGYSNETGYATGTLDNGSKYIEMVTGEFPASKKEQTITFNLKLQFPDTGINQDSEKGKSINAEVVVNYDSKIMVQTISKLYKFKSKDENGITEDGLQKDGTGNLNINLVNNNYNKLYNISFLNSLIADTEYDVYDNLRYVGATPKNYLSFNNEVWRIIGIFNVYNNDTNSYQKLIKIIRNNSLGDYSWDTSESSINEGQGINEWSQADLMMELNNNYLDTSKISGTTTWYNGLNNKKTAIYNYDNNIKLNYIDKIANVRWNLGGTRYALTAVNSYEQERGTNHVVNPIDGIIRQNTWNGKIGLMYPSDYGFASIDVTCRSNMNSGNCKNNNWLFNGDYQWTLAPYPSNPYIAFIVGPGGDVDNGGVYWNDYGVRPTLFLKPDVQIVSGSGTSADPYIVD